jgi:hypothetical protein
MMPWQVEATLCCEYSSDFSLPCSLILGKFKLLFLQVLKPSDITEIKWEGGGFFVGTIWTREGLG